MKSRGRAKPVRRARRVPVATEKSRPTTRSGAAAKAVKAPKAAAKKTSDRRKTARPVAAERRKAKPAAAPRKVAPPKVEKPAVEPEEVKPETLLTDEEQIESAKYQPRRTTPRVFEEERFLFPQSYGINRLRLLVKDPEWLFAYWDVDPSALDSLRAELGSRAQALSQLTLRIFEDRRGGSSTFLLPQDARTWYVPARAAGRSYRAEVGVILPSGEFRPLAQSNSVTTPRTGRSAQKAKKRVRYDVRQPIAALAAAAAGVAALAGEETAALDHEYADEGEGPTAESWSDPVTGARSSPSARGKQKRERGGASDVHRR